MKEYADDYNELWPKPRSQENQSVLATANLDEVVTQIDLLFNDTLDLLVKPFETKEPDFFKAYKNARYIIIAASHKTTKPGVETPPVVR